MSATATAEGKATETATALPEPIFIIAMPKSYTTITSTMLGEHPALASVPELNLFVGDTVADWARQSGWMVLKDGLLRTVAQVVFGAQTAETVQQAYAWLESRADWPSAQLFDHLREAVAPAALIEQSPRHTAEPAYLERIAHAYPRARYLHITRNPSTWAPSMAKWRMAEQILALYDPTGGRDWFDLWHFVNESLGLYLATSAPGRVMHLRGEDVVSHPGETLQRITDWLGLATEPAEIEAMRHPERSIYAGWGPPGAPGGSNPDFMQSPSLRSISDPERLLELDTATLPPAVAEYGRSLGYR